MGRLYRLRLTLGVIVEYEQITKNKLCDISLTDSAAMSVLLWLMMRRENEELTYKDSTEAILKHPDKVDIFVAAGAAVRAAFDDIRGASGKSDYFDFGGYFEMAAEIGTSPDVLWELTPAEFSVLQKTHIRKKKIDYNSLIKQAWYTAYFGRVKDFPEMQKYLIDISENAKPKAQTDEEMQDRCKMIALLYGGTVSE